MAKQINVFEVIASGQATRLQMQRAIDKESSDFGHELQKIPLPENATENLLQVWRSRDFLVQVFRCGGTIRISVNRSKIAKSGTMWQDGIKWDDLQRIKQEIGFGEKCAVELYPPDQNVVYVANMRHLFILDEIPKFMWGSQKEVSNAEGS